MLVTLEKIGQHKDGKTIYFIGADTQESEAFNACQVTSQAQGQPFYLQYRHEPILFAVGMSSNDFRMALAEVKPRPVPQISTRDLQEEKDRQLGAGGPHQS